MKTVYLINEIILFSPEECSLTPKSGWPSGRITLHAPAAECLQLLLNHVGQPVTQKLLFAQVWEKKGAVVSTNTLYQSIASIRKGLKTAGLEEDIIRTLPKQGFQCNARVQVGNVSDFILPATPTTQKSSPAAASLSAPEKPTRSRKYSLAASVMVSVLMVCALLYWQRNSDTEIPTHYYPAGMIEHCSLYSSWSGAEYSQTVFNELRQRYPVSCANRQFAYLTINHLQTGSTLILCNDEFRTKGVQCRSIMFSDENHEAK
jgi:DNA-binding winged helix-turn-helix (wHTH) protein